MKLFNLLAAAALLALLPSCTTPTHRTSLVQASTVRVDQLREGVTQTQYSYWSDEGVSAPLRVRIDLSEQTAYFFRGAVKVGQSRVATGRAGHSTPIGSFTILEKVTAKRSTLYGRIYDANGNVKVGDADTRCHSIPEGGKFVGCPMPYWMRLTGSGIGMPRPHHTESCDTTTRSPAPRSISFSSEATRSLSGCTMSRPKRSKPR